LIELGFYQDVPLQDAALLLTMWTKVFPFGVEQFVGEPFTEEAYCQYQTKSSYKAIGTPSRMSNSTQERNSHFGMVRFDSSTVPSCSGRPRHREGKHGRNIARKTGSILK
jgi:hypothetical protein